MTGRTITIETIPDVPEDTPEPLKGILKALKNWADVREGRLGPIQPFKVRLTRFVTLEDLMDAGFAIVENSPSLNSAANAGVARTAIGEILADTATIDFTYDGETITATVRDESITFAKMQEITDETLIGRAAGTDGVPQEITVGAGLSLSAGELASTITQYTDELAQDAIGAMVNGTLVYVDATPALGRAALTGDVTASAGSNATTLVATSSVSEVVQDIIGGIVANSTYISLTYNDATPSIVASFVNTPSGVYTPTLTNVANLDGSTAYQCQWSRNGDMVTVSGLVGVDPTAGATLTQLGMSLPIASNIGAIEDCAGCAHSNADAQGASIIGDTANDRAEFQFISVGTANIGLGFTFMYQIL